MADNNVKKIRDLNDFTTVNPMTTGDHLVVSSSEGDPATNKATIKDVVGLYLTSSASSADDQPDQVLDENGDLVPNPLKGATTVTEIVDTDGDGNPDTSVEVVNTPITAKNIDTLVDPGSGLEVNEICQDEDFNIVECEVGGNPNPEVKYKTKKLALATSAESKTVNINVNNTGVVYTSGITQTNGTVNVKFKRLRDAFAYIRNDIGAPDTVVNINIENDLDEGDIEHTNSIYSSGASLEQNRCYININGSGYGSGNQPKKIKLKAKSDTNNSTGYVLMWFNAYRVEFSFLNFILDLDDNHALHAVFRSHNECNLKFIGCKISARGSAHKLFEASRGGTLEVQNYSDTDLDPLSKDFWAPALELDFGPRKENATSGSGLVGDDFYCDYFIGADTGGVIRFPEYAPYAPWEGAFLTNFQSRIHFASDKFKCDSFLSLESNCIVDIIAIFTMSDILSFAPGDIPYFLRAAAFNSVTVRNGQHMKGTLVNIGGTDYAEFANSFPGSALANPTNQVGGTSTAGQDYIMTNNISPISNLLSTYKGDDGAGNPTSGPLTNYWDNVTWSTI